MSKAKGKAPEPVPAEAVKIEPQIVRGSGEFRFPDDSEYNGEWKEIDGIKVRDGTGVFIHGPEKYTGQWVDDKMHGQGEYLFASGAKYKGNFVANIFNGEGEYHFPDGAIYSGSWNNNKMHGFGNYKDKEGIEFKGQFVNGMYDSGKTYISVRGNKM